MENSASESETHQSFRSPPRRRRSTFFERRDSIVPQAESENVDPNASVKTSEINNKHNQELTNYYEKLMTEKEQWKKEVNSRRNKYHDLRQQYQMAVKSSGRSRISYAVLSNEDIEFLKAKPNISKLVEHQQKLQKSMNETIALYRRANELDDIILKCSEEKINTITEYILENSTVDLIE